MSPCPRPALARCYSPPRWPPWDEGAALPFPPGTASSPCPARDVRPPPRVSPLRGIALWKPQPAQPPRSQRAERGLAERMRSPARRVPLLAHLSSTCCGPIHPPLAVLQASPRGGQPSATPQLPCSLTQRLRSSLQCPARSSRCCHPPPDPCHTLCQLCAPAAEVILPICGHLWAPSLRLPCSRSCSARSLCLCAAGRWQPLSATPTLWEWVRAGMS